MLNLLVSLLFALPTTIPADVQMQPAAEVPLAVEVFEAHGGAAWDEVKKLSYTFKVEQDGAEVVSRPQTWNKAQGTVTVGDETVLTSQISDSVAFKAWTNDSYWLVAPLKLMDPGVMATELKTEGPMRQLLIGFEDVGLTPGDQYLYDVNPDGTIAGWMYMPEGKAGKSFAWTGYTKKGPLTLSLDHMTPDGFRVYFTDVTVE